MDEIAEFIINNIGIDADEELNHSVMQCGSDMYMNLDDMRDELLKTIDVNKITEFTLYPENHYKQRETIISFKWFRKTCEIGEHYGTQRDYFYVTIKPFD